MNETLQWLFSYMRKSQKIIAIVNLLVIMNDFMMMYGSLILMSLFYSAETCSTTTKCMSCMSYINIKKCFIWGTFECSHYRWLGVQSASYKDYDLRHYQMGFVFSWPLNDILHYLTLSMCPVTLYQIKVCWIHYTKFRITDERGVLYFKHTILP